MESGVVLAITDRLAVLGIPSLRFNFRGVGRSEGRYDDGRGELDDLKAAVSFLGKEEGIDPGKIGLAGYSFGAEIVMRMAVESSARRPVLAVSPVVSSITGRRWNITPGPKLVVCGDSDAFLPADRLRAGTLGRRAPHHRWRGPLLDAQSGRNGGCLWRVFLKGI